MPGLGWKRQFGAVNWSSRRTCRDCGAGYNDMWGGADSHRPDGEGRRPRKDFQSPKYHQSDLLQAFMKAGGANARPSRGRSGG
eukprot:9605484-Alexandrium_andersonii.AAC.1